MRPAGSGPVADAHGAVVLFSSRDAADLYAAEHDAAVGSPMPTMKAAALWSAARMTLAADGGSYEITALPDVERRTDAKRPGARMSGLSTMDVLAKTPGGRARPRRPRGPRRCQSGRKGPRPESGDRPPRVPRTALDGGGPMTRRYYAVLTRTDMPIIPYHVHAFDSAARRDAWCAGPIPRGFDAQPATGPRRPAGPSLRHAPRRRMGRHRRPISGTPSGALARRAPMTPRRPTRPRAFTSGGAGAR